MAKDEDIKDVMREEGSRGRKRVDTAARKKHQQRLKDFQKLLNGTEEEFISAIRAGGIRADSPLFLEALRIWRENRS
jgi:hypothetical protein